MTASEDEALAELWALLAPYAERENDVEMLEKSGTRGSFESDGESFEPTMEQLMNIVGIGKEDHRITPLISTSRTSSIPERPIFPSSTMSTTTTYLQAQAQDQGPIPFPPIPKAPGDTDDDTRQGSLIFILLPLLIVLATLLFLLLVFLIAIIVTRRKKGIR